MCIKHDFLELLREWCDALVLHEVKLRDKELFGGILCPACSFIHGRCADATFPLLFLYSKTGDENYLTLAKNTVEYSENNLCRPDGSYYNDVNQTWRGITVFSALALGESLLHFGTLLDRRTQEEWERIFLRLTSAAEAYFANECRTPNVNYSAAMAALGALACVYTGDGHYADLAKRYESLCRTKFDSDGLLFGEGGGYAATEKGCRAIDMGYNLEESLPSLLKYAKYMNDSEAFAFYTARTLDHLALILPDGAVDNSFGTRKNKWTYWGSRTSDGMMGALALLADENPIAARAALDNFRLMRRCTSGGLLYAGLMQRSAGEPPCIHHTFTHAKALAEFCLKTNGEISKSFENAAYAREREGVRSYQNGNLMTVTRGELVATVNALDFKENEGGGTLSLLWKRGRGAVLAATLHEYRAAEPYNMQYQRHANKTECMTPRFVSGDFSSDTDGGARLSLDGFCVLAKSESFPLEITYDFKEEGLALTVRSEREGSYILPIVSEEGENITLLHGASFEGGLSVRSDGECELVLREDKKRFFNQVGGFQYAVLTFGVKANTPLEIFIS